MGQVHHCTAREIKEIIQGEHFLRFLGVIIRNLYLPLPLSATPIGVSANNAYHLKYCKAEYVQRRVPSSNVQVLFVFEVVLIVVLHLI